MRSTIGFAWLLVCAVVACGDPDGELIEGPYATMQVGPAGGTLVVSEGGPTLTIPVGALSATTTITITKETHLAVDEAVTGLWRFEPEGLVFATPATVSFPTAGAATALSVYWTQPAALTFEELDSSQTAQAVTASIEHFSLGYIAPATPAVAVGDHHTFVMNRIFVPTSNTQAREFGLDLNDDRTVDNQLGMVFATLSGMGTLVQENTDTAVDRGLALMLADFQTTEFVNAQDAGIKTFLGATPSPAPCTDGSDTVCRHHLTGTGTFSIASSSPMDGYLVGNTITGTFTSKSPGHAVMQFALNANRALTVHLIGARAKISGASATGITTGVIAGGLNQAEVDTVVIPELAYSANFAIMRDCTMLSSPPTCGCADGTEGKTQKGLFDTNQDCSVSETEIKNNSLIVSLLAPDVTVEGQTAISLGFKFTAVPGAFALP